MIFEWVVTDAPDAALVGVGQFDRARLTAPNARAALQVAASLPGSFTVETEDGKPLIRGKCADITQGRCFQHLIGPVVMARTFYNETHRVVYKLGDAIVGVYI